MTPAQYEARIEELEQQLREANRQPPWKGIVCAYTAREREILADFLRRPPMQTLEVAYLTRNWDHMEFPESALRVIITRVRRRIARLRLAPLLRRKSAVS